MTRGGKRHGAGRPRGAVNKMTRATREAAAATGKLPHELLLAVARGEKVPGFGRPTRDERLRAMRDAAPYYAPRLAAVVAKINAPGNPWKEILDLIDGTSRGLPSGAAGAIRRRVPVD